MDSIWSGRASEDFVPDGNLGKQIWAEAQQALFDRDAFLDLRYPEIETSVATLWTTRYLYLGYRCRFQRLHIFEAENPAEERWELWNRDVVEAFIAPPGVAAAHYFEFEVAPNNQWLDVEVELRDGKPIHREWNSGFLHATRVDEMQGMWTAEMRIPVEAMGVKKIDTESSWRINFCRCDGPAKERRLLSWRSLETGYHSFHQPTRFGMLRFADSEGQSPAADAK